MAGSPLGALLILAVLLVVIPVPIFVIGRRRGVGDAWVAFIPLVGPTVVLLWSAGRLGWMWLLSFVPIVNLVFMIWLCFRVPAAHGRTRWWGLSFLVPFVNLVAWYAYAYSLARPRADAPARSLATS